MDRWRRIRRWQRDKGPSGIVLRDGAALCVCLAITSKQKNVRYGYRLNNIGCVNLTKESWVKFGYIELTPKRFKHKLGVLDDEDIVGIQRWLFSYSYSLLKD